MQSDVQRKYDLLPTLFVVAEYTSVSRGEWAVRWAFLALCKVGFVPGFCVPCNVLKIALGRVAESC
jgi:hypothetical protein